MSAISGVRSRLDTLWGGEYFGAYGLIWQTDDLGSRRDRSRRLEEDNVLACGVLDRTVENVIGTGITMRAATLDKAWNRRADDEWRRLTEDTRLDVRRMHSFGQLQQLLYRSGERDGDVGMILIDRGYGPELQIIEGQDVETPYGYSGLAIQDGIEVDSAKRPVAYWVREYDQWGVITHRRFEARDVIWLHNHYRYNVVRGIPLFNGMYEIFDQIKGYFDAVVVAARVGASQAVIVETDNPAGAVERAAAAAAAARGRGVAVEDSIGIPRGAVAVQPGMFNYVKPGYKVSAFNPTQPTTQFPDAIRTFGRFIGLKSGLTIERVLLDFSGANYSVSRSTALQEQKTAEIEQDTFYRRALVRIWRYVISKQVKAGVIAGPAPKDFWRHEWMPQGRPLVEPSKDAAGEIALINANLSSFKNYCAARGENWEQIAQDNSEAIKLYQSLGVSPPPPAGSKTATDSPFSNTPIEPNGKDE